MENEVFEEVYIDDTNEIVNSDVLVDSVVEAEEDSSFNQDELISALLSVLNDKRLDQEEEASQIEDVIVEEVIESEPLPDYTDLLTTMDSRLDTLESLALEPEEDYSLYTPLNQYKLDSILLVIIFIVTFVNLGYQFIKDNLLHF